MEEPSNTVRDSPRQAPHLDKENQQLNSLQRLIPTDFLNFTTSPSFPFQQQIAPVDT